MAEVPRRAPRCEAALQGALLDSQAIERAAAELAADYTPIDDFRASAAYRTQVGQNLLRRLLIELTTPEQAVRLADA